MLKTAYSLFKIPNDEALNLILNDRNSSHGTLKKYAFSRFRPQKLFLYHVLNSLAAVNYIGHYE